MPSYGSLSEGKSSEGLSWPGNTNDALGVDKKAESLSKMIFTRDWSKGTDDFTLENSNSNGILSSPEFVNSTLTGLTSNLTRILNGTLETQKNKSTFQPPTFLFGSIGVLLISLTIIIIVSYSSDLCKKKENKNQQKTKKVRSIKSVPIHPVHSLDVKVPIAHLIQTQLNTENETKNHKSADREEKPKSDFWQHQYEVEKKQKRKESERKQREQEAELQIQQQLLQQQQLLEQTQNLQQLLEQHLLGPQHPIETLDETLEHNNSMHVYDTLEF